MRRTAAVWLLGSVLALGGGAAWAEQHGDGYGSRSADDQDYGGGQGQYEVLPAPLYLPPPYVAVAPSAYPPRPPAYAYVPRPYRLPPLRPPVVAYPYPYPYPYGYGAPPRW